MDQQMGHILIVHSIYRKLTKEILLGLDCKPIPLTNFSADKLTYKVDIISK